MLKLAYSVNEAAAAMAVKAAVIEAAMRSGELNARQAGSMQVILHGDLAAWAEALPLVD